MHWWLRKKQIDPMDNKAAIVSIHIAAIAAVPTQSVRAVKAVAGQGLEGDRYAAKLGTFSNDPGSGRDVTLIEIEAIEALERDYQIKIDPGQLRRNIVSRGLALNHLVGQELMIGEVVVRSTRLCEPCSHLETLTAKGIMRGLVHRGGLRVEVRAGGIIHVGDTITIAAPARR